MKPGKMEAIFPLSTWEAESGGNLYEFKASLVFIEGSRTPGILGGLTPQKKKLKGLSETRGMGPPGGEVTRQSAVNA